MGKLQNNQNGFSVIEGLLILVIVAIIGGTGWFIYNAKRTADNNLTSSSSATPTFKKRTTVNSSTKSVSTVSPVTSPSKSATTTTPSTAAIATNPTTTAAPQASTSATAYEVYNISADGTTATETPVTTKLNATSVTLTVNLTCAGACQFKLVSDNYSLANTTTYASSQKIIYTISKPGQYTFYNQYTPNTKFNIAF